MAFGRPAFGYECTKHSAASESACRKGNICEAPSAQLRPMTSGFECCIEM